MARLFDYRTAITDPDHFFGRTEFLKTICQAPFECHVLLGGSRIGKTSALRAVEWNFLNPEFKGRSRAFPVFIDLQLEQPKDPDNFRYMLITQLRKAIERWKKTPLAEIRAEFRKVYKSYLHQVVDAEVSLGSFLKLKIRNPDQEQQLISDDFLQLLSDAIDELKELRFDGVCFLIDEIEFAITKEWGNDVSSYIRGLMDSKTEIRSCLGFLLSGYPDLKKYTQEVGSPLLNIAKFQWLQSLNEPEARELINFRIKEENEKLTFTEEDIVNILGLTGCHPCLLQQTLNNILDNSYKSETISSSIKNIKNNLLVEYNHYFSNWWEKHFNDDERTVYHTLIERREGTDEELTQFTGFKFIKLHKAFQVLAATGVIHQIDDNRYAIGGRLFEEWVIQQKN